MNNKHWLSNGFRAALTLLALSGAAASTQAHALDMMIWNESMETKLAYGESQGQVLRGQLVRSASGSVVILFSRSDTEQGRSLFPGLKSRYEGEIRGGQVWVKVPGSGMQPLEQFLAAYRLKVDLDPVGGK